VVSSLAGLSGYKQLVSVGRVFLFLTLELLLSPVMAQHKVQRSAAFWPELQVEYVFKSTSYLYFRNQYRHNLDNDFNHLQEKGPLEYVERAQFRAGFEHMFNSQWSGGIAEAYAFESTRNILFNELFVRHLGAIGSFRFTKRASLEHIVQTNKDNRGRFRLRLDADREFKIKDRSIRPRIAYELFFDQYYNTELNKARNTRQVDRIRLRLEILYSLNAHLALTPFFIRQTDYITAPTTNDANGNVLQPGGKQNNVTPIFGIDMRYAIFKGGTPFSRIIKGNK